MTDNIASPITRIQQAALIFVMLMVFTEALTVAFSIGAIMTKFGASGAHAGFVATAQGLGTATAAMVGTRLISQYTARNLIAFGLVLVAVGHGLSLVATNVLMMAAFQALGGLGTGLVICVVLATAARTPKPELTYGWINGSAGAYLSILALVVPKLLIFGGFAALYGFYSLLAVVGLLCLSAIPNVRAPSSARASAATDTGRFKIGKIAHKSGWIALFGMGIFYFSIAGMGAFIARIGVNLDISLETIGMAFFVGGMLTIVCPIAAGFVGARFGSTRPLLLVGGLMCLTAFGIAVSGNSTSFLMGVPMWIVLPAILTPSFLGGLAVIDPTGKLAGAQPAFATLGGSMGPMIAGAVADAGGFGTLGIFIVCVLTIGLLLMGVATLRADGLRQHAVAVG
ncbi:MFS transporter [Parasphingorhabdus sp.]|uniref:MFS transporter n=1 Tax=Parasphingorhabdus sp. TaxID=2709688 RepID=UPI003593F4C0